MGTDINFEAITIEDCINLLMIGKRIIVNDGEIKDIMEE